MKSLQPHGTLVVALLVLLLAAAPATAADSPYRLRVLEPAKGKGVPHGPVRVVVSLDLQPPDTTAPKNVTPTPTPAPRIEVFVDKESRGVVPPGQSELILEGLPPGSHTLLVTVSDSSGIVVERKEAHFTVLPPLKE